MGCLGEAREKAVCSRQGASHEALLSATRSTQQASQHVSAPCPPCWHEAALSGPSSGKRREVERTKMGRVLLRAAAPPGARAEARRRWRPRTSHGTRRAGVCGAQPACDSPRMSRETAHEWLSTESG